MIIRENFRLEMIYQIITKMFCQYASRLCLFMKLTTVTVWVSTISKIPKLLSVLTYNGRGEYVNAIERLLFSDKAIYAIENNPKALLKLNVCMRAESSAGKYRNGGKRCSKYMFFRQSAKRSGRLI